MKGWRVPKGQEHLEQKAAPEDLLPYLLSLPVALLCNFRNVAENGFVSGGESLRPGSATYN